MTKNPSLNFDLYSTDPKVCALIQKAKGNTKVYEKLLETLFVLGSFSNKNETIMYELIDNKNRFCIKLACLDDDDNLFIFNIDSTDKNDLFKVEKNTKDRNFVYDFSLAKRFQLNSENIEFIRSSEQYNFRFGRLVTDRESFYTVFLGDDLGYQIKIQYEDKEQVIPVNNLLDYLNGLEIKPGLYEVMKLFEKLLDSNNCRFSSINLIAFKNLEKVGELCIDSSKISFGVKQTQSQEPEKLILKDNGNNNSGYQPIPETSLHMVEIPSEIVVGTHNILPQKKKPKRNKLSGQIVKKPQDDVIYLDQKGKEDLLQKIEELKQEIILQQKIKGESTKQGADTYHDNFVFEEAERMLRMLTGQLKRMRSILNKVVPIERQEPVDSDKIDIGDLVLLTGPFGGNEEETRTCLFSASVVTDDEYHVVSINGPLGRAIYHHQIGETVKYSVNGRHSYAKIEEKVQQKKY